MAAPKVSIIIPVYKAELFLQRCVQSVTAQTLKDIEIILIDDGSPDRCGELCDRLAAQDARIRVEHKQNEGAGMARNSGLALATGQYIGFVDADDYVEPKMYENLYVAAERVGAQVAMSGMRFVDGNMFSQMGDCIEKPSFSEETVFEGESVCELMLGIAGAMPKEKDDSRYGMSVCTNLYRTDFVRQNGLRFLSERDILSEDALFSIDCLAAAQTAVGVPGALYCYCRNGASVSKSYNPKRLEKSAVFLKELEKRFSEKMPASRYQIYFDRTAQGFGRILCSQEILHAFEMKMPYKKLRVRLKTICTQAHIAAALKTYPWYQLPTRQAVFAFLMKYRLYLLQVGVVALRR